MLSLSLSLSPRWEEQIFNSILCTYCNILKKNRRKFLFWAFKNRVEFVEYKNWSWSRDNGFGSRSFMYVICLLVLYIFLFKNPEEICSILKSLSRLTRSKVRKKVHLKKIYGIQEKSPKIKKNIINCLIAYFHAQIECVKWRCWSSNNNISCIFFLWLKARHVAKIKFHFFLFFSAMNFIIFIRKSSLNRMCITQMWKKKDEEMRATKI